jgi:uncharacterized membrane protein (DUF106 family)
MPPAGFEPTISGDRAGTGTGNNINLGVLIMNVVISLYSNLVGYLLIYVA